LQGADADRERDKSEPVKAHMLLFLRFFHEQPHTNQGDDADRQIDQEYPVPGIIISKPCAQCRAHDRTQHDADAPDRHRLAALFRRGVDIEQNGLRQAPAPPGHACSRRNSTICSMFCASAQGTTRR
jgi:hypothetical protein